MNIIRFVDNNVLLVSFISNNKLCEFKKQFLLFFLGCVCIKDHYHDTSQSRHEPLKCSKESDCSCYDEQTKLYHQPGSIVKRGQCSTW